MAELDRLLVADISRVAAELAQQPDFAAIERRGRQRRRTHAVVVSAAAAVVVGIVVLGTSLVGGPGDTTPSPAPEPSSTDSANGPIVKAGGAPRRWTHPTMESESPGSGPLTYSRWEAVDPASGSILYGEVASNRMGVVDESGPVAEVECPITPEPGSGRAPGCELGGQGDVAFGPGDDELTFVPAQLNEPARSLTIVGYDGEVRETLDLPDAVPDTALEMIAWSPDGGRLAVAMETPDGGPGEVWIVPRDGSGARLAHREEAPLIDGDVHAPVVVDLAWSPDSSRLGVLVAPSRDLWTLLSEGIDPSLPRPRLIVVPAADGKAQTLHTFDYGSNAREAFAVGDYVFAFAFAWSPDGQRVALTHQGGIAEISATDGTVLVEHPGVGDSGPLAWLPEEPEHSPTPFEHPL